MFQDVVRPDNHKKFKCKINLLKINHFNHSIKLVKSLVDNVILDNLCSKYWSRKMMTPSLIGLNSNI